MENSKIQWTNHTFNAWRGCTKVSPGCANCYADVQSKRNPATLGIWGPKGTRVVASESAWREPLKWDRAAKEAGERHRVFCASMSDVFEDWDGTMTDSKGQTYVICDSCMNPDGNFQWGSVDKWEPTKRIVEHGCGEQVRLLTMQDVRTRLFNLIDATPNLDWLLLTKRPENIARMMPEYVRTTPSENYFFDPEEQKRRGLTHAGPHKSTMSVSGLGVYRPNVWLGTSVENQQTADERIPHLLQVPAAVRFLSCEPLLGPVVFSDVPVGMLGPLRPHVEVSPNLPRIDWVIVGGESGHGARNCEVEWIRSIVKQCKSAGVPVFVKQLGAIVGQSNPTGDEVRAWGETKIVVADDGVRFLLNDRKGGDPEEWPEDLRVREFPRVGAAS